MINFIPKTKFPQLPLSQNDFETIRNSKAFYVDKTNFIKWIVDAYPAKTNILFLRPRSFGKTLFLSTLKCFFEDTRDPANNECRKSLFNGLSILGSGEKYTSLLQAFPVINVSFSGLDCANHDITLASLKKMLSSLFAEFRDLLEEAPRASYREKFCRYLNQEASMAEMSHSLLFLSRFLHDATGNKPIMLLDDYDAPFLATFANNNYPELLSVIKQMLTTGLKSNDHLEFAVLMGQLRIAEPGPNNLAVYDQLSSRCGTCFGFTEAETRHALETFELLDQFENVESMYNGYRFGNANIYNILSVLGFIGANSCASTQHDSIQFPSPWTASNGNDLFARLINMRLIPRESLNALIKGGSITTPMQQAQYLSKSHLTRENVWSILLYTGYLTIIGITDANELLLSVPNQEVMSAYKDAVLK